MKLVTRKLHCFCQDEFESEDIERVTVDKKDAFNKFKGKYLDSDSTGLTNFEIYHAVL